MKQTGSFGMALVCAKRRTWTWMIRLSALALAGLCILLALPVFAIPVFAATSAASPTTTQENVTEKSETLSVLPDLPVQLSGQSAIVLETGRSRILFEKNSDQAINIPASAKLMTALVAAEKLQMDTMITISNVAAEIDDQAVFFGQTALKTGDKYSFEYLLLRMLFYDSDAAAQALAEQISGEEAEFVIAMNSKAQSLELTQTNFVSSTGLPAVPDTQKNEAAKPALTTLKDLAKLVSVIAENKQLAAALSKSSEYLVLEGPKVVSMHHQLESIWTMGDGRVTGVFYSNRFGATTITFGTTNNIPIISIVQGGKAEKAITDSLALYDAIDHTYEIATLVEAGDHFFGGQEQTIDGEKFGLVYLKSAVQYQSFGPFSRPILSGAVVGQALFKLIDGTTIAVDVGPDRQILSSVTLFDRALKQLQSNPNLTFILLALLSTLILVLVVKLLTSLVRLTKIAFLLFFEIRSRR
jgi:D-alanyl-D-alanine carboxypeptidase (penicillin-binding protein 5/6)